MTSADNSFWIFEQAASYYQFAIVNYIGFQDRGMLLAGGGKVFGHDLVHIACRNDGVRPVIFRLEPYEDDGEPVS